MTYGLFSRMISRSGRREELVGFLVRAAELLESNPSCVLYSVATGPEPELVYVYEVWTDQQAHDTSLQAPEIRTLIDTARPAIAGIADQMPLTVHSGNRLRS
jgi:quinol monooxygenase YgiN